MTYKIGSLFDGSGGFPLAATMCGIEPVWASEIEPYPIAVTKSRFPNMKHLGSITDINGAEIEPVDILSFGAPCQDLSVAGLRKGLRHETLGDEETTRSGLFMEAIRIIKEMREATNGEYPRYAIYENVPGAFSSSKGRDWRVVLEELIRIAEPTAVMPDVPKAGWPYADSYCGEGWSLSYRTFDAQHWGVPQRRRRIYLVADFRGQRAGKILFERDRLCRNYTESGAPWQATAGDAEGSIGADDREGKCYGVTTKGNGDTFISEERHTSGCEGGGKGALVQTDMSATLATNNDQYLFQPVPYSIENHPADSRVRIDESGKVQTLTSRMGTGGGNVPMVMEPKPVYPIEGNGARPSHLGDGYSESDKMYTLNTIERHAVAYGMETFHCTSEEEKTPTLKARDWKDPHEEKIYPTHEEVHEFIADNNADAPHQQDLLQAADGIARTIACGTHASGSHLTKTVINLGVRYIVRRLTPTECARLQGFPDKWGHPEWISEDVKGEEPSFWRDVYMTDCAIKGKKPKPRIAEMQSGWETAVIRWHNQLHTDSSEFKMWGNGIALPCSLHVMQGIAEVGPHEPRN